MSNDEKMTKSMCKRACDGINGCLIISIFCPLLKYAKKKNKQFNELVKCT